MFMVKRTTIIFRDDIYQILKERAGAKNVSDFVNRILAEHFAKKGSMFGTMKRTDVSDLRDHRDRT
jgi:predicted CopG family antitoxin